MRKGFENKEIASEAGKKSSNKGKKQARTILKEELGLTDTKQLPTLVMEIANSLYKKAAGDFNKEYLIWKELAKAGLPKTNINVGTSFEDWLKENDGNRENKEL